MPFTRPSTWTGADLRVAGQVELNQGFGGLGRVIRAKRQPELIESKQLSGILVWAQRHAMLAGQLCERLRSDAALEVTVQLYFRQPGEECMHVHGYLLGVIGMEQMG
jgi:hypothetical protein